MSVLVPTTDTVFQEDGLQVGNGCVIHRVHAFHRSTVLPQVLHHDTGWTPRGVGWRPPMVRQVHVPERSVRNLLRTDPGACRNAGCPILWHILHALPVRSSLGQPHFINR